MLYNQCKLQAACGLYRSSSGAAKAFGTRCGATYQEDLEEMPRNIVDDLGGVRNPDFLKSGGVVGIRREGGEGEGAFTKEPQNVADRLSTVTRMNGFVDC